MRKLAFDLGTKTCGFAITDSLEIAPNALETIYFELEDFDFVFNKVAQYLNIYSDINGFVVGYPLRSNGDKSERTIMCENFATKLKNKFNLDTFLVNEYGSTIKAQNTLKSAKLSSKKRKNFKDTLAAVIILQDYLEYGGHKI
ncbi:Holliday junction resolvase RuvX [Mycoplasmopsis phocirhinis]|uniref:Putative pre-16S rRNA nuclease n=1 Tax=Mycoplasmopsis phocirhinis TaxID=142650 RepID=A0A4P6MMM0_9BACT|nr:Holliday junction resolvase RuvX [Mycoplasmopsis phocirhinis]QBF34758.1 Holliday junction resolvase RuvX [Mycoplasmopsis phocirhinis]